MAADRGSNCSISEYDHEAWNKFTFGPSIGRGAG